MKKIAINLFYKIAGIVFLILAKTKNKIQGYSTPRTFSLNEFDKGVKYGFKVVDSWLHELSKYKTDTIAGTNILELGPGADLGVGLYLLYKGAKQYNAIDVNNLVASVPDQFYNHFFKSLHAIDPIYDSTALKNQLKLTQNHTNDKLNYVCRSDFNITSVVKKESIDIVFSQAAFEHFDNVHKTIKQLSQVSKSGALFVVLIDLKTHSRWINSKDPNNIYRYSDWFYNIFKFPGSPNRLRPYEYREILEKNGWYDIRLIQKNKYIHDETIFYNKRFQDSKNQMDALSIWICATKR
jgi:SAM-dependent methyltransferase